jgi:hypothetical protein
VASLESRLGARSRGLIAGTGAALAGIVWMGAPAMHAAELGSEGWGSGSLNGWSAADPGGTVAVQGSYPGNVFLRAEPGTGTVAGAVASAEPWTGNYRVAADPFGPNRVVELVTASLTTSGTLVAAPLLGLLPALALLAGLGWRARKGR